MVGVLQSGEVLARLGCAGRRSAAERAAVKRLQAVSWWRPVGCSWREGARNYWGRDQQSREAGWKHGDGVQRPRMQMDADLHWQLLDMGGSLRVGSAGLSVCS